MSKWRKQAKIVLSAIGTLLLTAGLIAAPAQAAPPYTTTGTVDSVAFIDETVQDTRITELSGTWSIADDPVPTAGFSLSLPPELQGFAETFPLLDPQGEPMGECVVTASEILCDLDADYITENPKNLHGTFSFWVRVDTGVTEETETTFYFNDEVSDTIVVTPVNQCAGDCPYNGQDALKASTIIDSNTVLWRTYPTCLLRGTRPVSTSRSPMCSAQTSHFRPRTRPESFKPLNSHQTKTGTKLRYGRATTSKSMFRLQASLSSPLKKTAPTFVSTSTRPTQAA